MIKIEIANSNQLHKILKDIEKNIKKNLREDVIENGLDDQLKADLEELKNRVRYIINVDIRSEEQVDKGAYLNQNPLNVPKSDEEILKQLTGLDITKFRTTKDYSHLIDSNVAVILPKGFSLDSKSAHPMSGGVNLRIPMDFMGSFDEQYNQAVDFFNRSLFLDINNNGEVSYLLNPGINLTDCVKIVCSTETGDTIRSRDKFEHHRGKRGYADWTLKAECVKKVRDNFVNLQNIVDKIKGAEFDEAISLLNRIQQTTIKNQTTQQTIDKIAEMKNGNGITPSVKAYSDIITMIKNLRLSKRITKSAVTYSLVSTSTEDIEVTFMERITKSIRMWKIDKEPMWVKAIINAVTKSANNTLRNSI